MKTIYEAFDGKTFNSPKDCTEYEIEQTSATLKLYGVLAENENGERVHSTGPAYVAYIADCDALSVFMNANTSNGSVSHYDTNTGLNVYADGEWRNLCDNAVASLRAYFKENDHE